MNCPFCGALSKVVGIICPNCKTDLPRAELIPIYLRILNEQRDLGRPENRKKLDELATHEFQIRRELTEVAKREELERLSKEESEKKEVLRKKTEENEKRAQDLKQVRAKRNKRVSKLLIVPITVGVLLGGGKFYLNKKEENRVITDCSILQTPSSERRISQSKSLSEIANLYITIKSYPYSTNFDYESAKKFLDRNVDNLNSQSLSSQKVGAFMSSFMGSALTISNLLAKEKRGKAIADVKEGNTSLYKLAETELAVFKENPCFGLLKQNDLLIDRLSFTSKTRTAFTSNFIVAPIALDQTARPLQKSKAEVTRNPTPKPTPKAPVSKGPNLCEIALRQLKDQQSRPLPKASPGTIAGLEVQIANEASEKARLQIKLEAAQSKLASTKADPTALKRWIDEANYEVYVWNTQIANSNQVISRLQGQLSKELKAIDDLAKWRDALTAAQMNLQRNCG
jgi:hypothetical protein